MIFKLEPDRLTKHMLVNLRPEEDYMAFYLGIVPDKGMHRNPLRVDRKPTCAFYRAKNGELIFKDFQTGQHSNFVEVVMMKFRCEYTRALKIIANDFDVISKPEIEKNKRQAEYTGKTIEVEGETRIQCEVQPFSNTELKWWQSYGIQADTLKKYNVVSVKNLFLNGGYMLSSNSRSPVYGYYFGKDEGRELWKIYFPLKTHFRFMVNTNKLQGVKQLPATGEYVVVTKALKDVMVLHELGIPAVAPQAESVIITARQYQALKKRFKHVIINGDWDRAGQRFMLESRKRFPCICLAFTDKECDGKDISDFVKKHGMERAREILVGLQQQIKDGLQGYQLRYCQPDTQSVSLPDDKETNLHLNQYAILEERATVDR